MAAHRGKYATPSFYRRVWAMVRKIPRGKVMTYGQIAGLLGSPRAARAVGYAMFNTQSPDVPWHRVINAKGEISIGGHLLRPDEQRARLLAEGVDLADPRQVIARYRYWPPRPRPTKR